MGEGTRGKSSVVSGFEPRRVWVDVSGTLSSDLKDPSEHKDPPRDDERPGVRGKGFYPHLDPSESPGSTGSRRRVETSQGEHRRLPGRGPGTPPS